MVRSNMASGERQGALWSTAPRDWAELQEPFCRPLWKDTLAALGIRPGTSFLDAGCGGGGACVLAAADGAEVTGLDAARPLLDIAQERVPRGTFVLGDLEQLPFPNARFDAALAANSVIFADDIRQALRELRRVLRASGRLAITAWGKPEQCEMRDVFAAVGGVLPQRQAGGGPFAWSGDGQLAALLGEVGFRNVVEGESRCDFRYEDFQAFWRAQTSAGNYQPALQHAGPARLRLLLQQALGPYTRTDGRIELRNVYRWAVGEAGA